MEALKASLASVPAQADGDSGSATDAEDRRGARRSAVAGARAPKTETKRARAKR